jgi:hypothetical protein
MTLLWAWAHLYIQKDHDIREGGTCEGISGNRNCVETLRSKQNFWVPSGHWWNSVGKVLKREQNTGTVVIEVVFGKVEAGRIGWYLNGTVTGQAMDYHHLCLPLEVKCDLFYFKARVPDLISTTFDLDSIIISCLSLSYLSLLYLSSLSQSP